MDDDQIKKMFWERRAKADTEYRKTVKEKDRERLRIWIRFNGQKKGASADYLVRSLEDKALKPIEKYDGRPGEKLGKGKTKGVTKSWGRGI